MTLEVLTPKQLYSGPNQIGSRAWVYKMLREGRIPYTRVGAKILIPKAALERLLDSDGAGQEREP